MTLTALIIDDEPLGRQELQYLLEGAEDVQVLAQGSNGIEAIDLIRQHHPDLVFLDVQMPGLDGFAVLKKLLERKIRLPQIVFATAFDQYAVRAFEVNAVDYLLKPFSKRRVLQTIEKAKRRIAELPNASNAFATAANSTSTSDLSQIEHAPYPPVDPPPASTATVAEATPSHGTEAKLDALLRLLAEQTQAARSLLRPQPPSTTSMQSGRVVVRAQNRLLLVDQREICFATIDGGAITVTTPTLEGLSNCRTLEELTDLLDPETFWRAHRSFVVNLQHIREVVPWFKSTYQLRMDDAKKTEIPVSRSQTKRLRELFNL